MEALKPYFQKDVSEAGCDEAGRGCYAGPVFAAAVILPKDFFHPLLNDSKQVKELQRNELRFFIEDKAIAFAVGMITHTEIDQINILKASFKAMHLAIDGNRFTAYNKIKHQCFVKGDSIYASIAAASILAKTYRDDWMKKIHEEFPQYNWQKNKGYGTLEHRKAIERFGLCKYHRMSFNILPQQTNLF